MWSVNSNCSDGAYFQARWVFGLTRGVEAYGMKLWIMRILYKKSLLLLLNNSNTSSFTLNNYSSQLSYSPSYHYLILLPNSIIFSIFNMQFTSALILAIASAAAASPVLNVRQQDAVTSAITQWSNDIQVIFH